MRTFCFALVVVGGLAGYWWLCTYEPVGVIPDQLSAIDEGRYPQAYEYLSSMTRATLPFEEFVALIQSNSVVMEVRDTSLPLRTREGPTVTISGVLTGYGHLISQASYVLVQEDGQWKIARFHWTCPQPE